MVIEKTKFDLILLKVETYRNTPSDHLKKAIGKDIRNWVSDEKPGAIFFQQESWIYEFLNPEEVKEIEGAERSDSVIKNKDDKLCVPFSIRFTEVR
ncbi:MAG: hypothetical protein OYG31_00885 [Candidatus Kaiserbacteria bacterium]|nr:hypothetical protein [Candidatus Kaiserbacteria bacterium]